jgi:peptidoglycan/LPS O-acetylase OafA/YrhL
MTTTMTAALATAVLGFGACGWVYVHGGRGDRMTAGVLGCVVLALALVFLSVGNGWDTAFDVALLAGVAGPLLTLATASRGRGVGGAAGTAAGGARRRHARQGD